MKEYSLWSMMAIIINCERWRRNENFSFVAHLVSRGRLLEPSGCSSHFYCELHCIVAKKVNFFLLLSSEVNSCCFLSPQYYNNTRVWCSSIELDSNWGLMISVHSDGTTLLSFDGIF